ncbi:MAG: class I SAM-dependent methyltransferase [Saprospiraceae bacterium]
MQKRHANRSQYFREQSYTTKKYVIPYILSIKDIHKTSTILEIGCGEGGNLEPFLEYDCKVFGIELLSNQFECAQIFYKDHLKRDNLTLINSDIYNINPKDLPSFDIIFMKDVIEHIPNQSRFLALLRDFLTQDGIVFFGFPPWSMPFGGHQQVCNSILSKIPYFHILPQTIYKQILNLGGEEPLAIKEFLEVKETGLSILRFHKIIRENNYKINRETYWFINPNYEVKFKIKPMELLKIFRIPWICDFYTTAIYCIISKK